MVSEYCSQPENKKVTEFYDGTLKWQDFIAFGMVLAISASIGIYFAIKSSKASLKEYMIGGGSLGPLPISLSISATYFSALTVLSAPVEFYTHGLMYLYVAVAFIVVFILSVEVFVPVYRRFGSFTIYQYLEVRYAPTVRYLVTVQFQIMFLVYIGLITYLPALALETSTGLNRFTALWIICGTCIVYTSMGGLKAVVWTDAFQMLIMVMGFSSIIIKGTIDFNGFGEIFDSYKSSGRAVLDDFSFDPRIRHTFWSVVVGSILGGTGSAFCASQSHVQRFMACRNQKEMRLAAYPACFMIVIVTFMTAMVGMVLFKYNECCDPYSAGWLDAKDKLVPYMTLSIFRNTPGLAGVYIAACLSGTLSTVSSGINSLATCFVTDLLIPNQARIFNTKKDERFYTYVTKVVSGMSSKLIFGISCISFAYMADNLGAIFQAALSLAGLMAGPLFGVFISAIFNPYSETVGIIVGNLCGVVMACSAYLGAKDDPPGTEFTKPMPTEISGCFGDFQCQQNSTERWCQIQTSIEDSSISEESTIFQDFVHMSYLYLGTIGLVTTFTVSAIVSGIRYKLGKHHPKYLPPFVLFKPFDNLFERELSDEKFKNVKMKLLPSNEASTDSSTDTSPLGSNSECTSA